MKILKALKYLDAKYLSKKILTETDAKSNLSKVSKHFKEKANLFFKECKTARFKLRDIPGTNYDLGLLHMKRGNISDAIMRFRMVIFLSPKKVDSYYNLGRCLIMSGDNDNAKTQFEKALYIDDKFAEAKYMLEKLQDPSGVKKIPTKIIKDIVENLEERAKNEKENNSSAKSLINAAINNIEDKNPHLKVLDLGAGSGECGKILRKKGLIKEITAVDISTKKIKKLVNKKIDGENIYNSTEESEIRDYLSKNKSKFDLITANLSLKYIGGLSDVAKYITKGLNKNGVFAFSVEEDEFEDDNEIGYRIDLKNDCFYYSKEYIKNIFSTEGLKELEIKNILLYKNSHSEYSPEEESENIEHRGLVFIYQNKN